MHELNRVQEKESIARAALFEGLVTSAMDAIIAVDANFHIIAFNPAAEAMFGAGQAEVMGRSLDRFIPERFRHNHRNHVERYARTGEAYRRMGALGAVRATRANGEEFNVEATISQTLIEGTRVACVILREVSDQLSDDALRLAREVDHRARNILAIVSSLISLTSGSSQENYADALAGRVAALSRANTLLSVERWKGASLASLVRGELSAIGAGRSVAVDAPDLLLTARAVQPMAMLLHELCSNALVHGALSAPGGALSVQWARSGEDGLALSWTEAGVSRAEGAPEAGLGLTLLHRIVEGQLRGIYRLDWRADGVRFEAELPSVISAQLADNAAQPVPAGTERRDTDKDKARAAEGGTLLIVEDEPVLAMQLARALGGFGWTVTGVAGSVEAANELLATNPRPDVAILDVDLGGVPVFPLARALRHAGIPFLFCTGYEDVAYHREFSDCTVIRKPATVLQIVAALRSTVHEASVAAR